MFCMRFGMPPVYLSEDKQPVCMRLRSLWVYAGDYKIRNCGSIAAGWQIGFDYF